VYWGIARAISALSRCWCSETGLRHLVPDHQLPHRTDVETQASGFHHSLHGGGWQGNIGNEAIRKTSNTLAS
jgi:hypothetical protein